MQKINKKETKKYLEILKMVVKGKGQFKTPRTPKELSDGSVNFLVPLYLKGLITFQREYDIPLIGPSNEHMVRYKWYVVTIDKNKTIKDLKKIIKTGKFDDNN